MRRTIILGAVVAVLALVLLSPRFGRATTVHNYRPDLPPDALACWPLPGGLRLPFAYQVRRESIVDGPRGPQRSILLQFDRIDPRTAEQRLAAAVRASGVRATYEVRPLPIPPQDAAQYVVRGEVSLTVPATAPPTSPPCDSPYATKDFPPGYGETP